MKKYTPFKEGPLEDLEPVPENWRGYVKTIRDTHSALRWIWETMDAEAKRRTGHMVIGLLALAILTTLQPRAITMLYQSIPGGTDRHILLVLGSLGLCLVGRELANYVHEYAREWILGLNIGSLDRHITERLFEKSLGQHIQEAHILGHENISKGRERTLHVQSILLFGGINTFLILFLSWALLWTISLIGGLVMTGSILIYAAWMLFLNYRVAVVCKPLDAESRMLHRYRAERWKNVDRVKLAPRGEEEVSYTSEWFEHYISHDRQFWLWFIRQNALRRAVGALAFLGVICYGVWRARHDPAYTPFLFPLIMWSAQIVENIWQIGHVEHNLHWSLPAIQSLIRALNLPPDIVNPSNPVILNPTEPIMVRFENVGHRYPDRLAGGRKSGRTTSPVLTSISFTVMPGEKVSLIAPSGVGKSTLMKLLLRFMNPTTGRILVNGHDLRSIDLESWARTVGYIEQRPKVWSGTIKDNLLYNLSPAERMKVTDVYLWELMQLLKIDFGDRLVDGLNTRVGRDGFELSGGQIQRVVIGAAFLKIKFSEQKEGRFMIIDEATSSLDSATEREVQDGLATVLDEDVSALVIAHRLSTVRRLCTKFIVLSSDNGTDGDGAHIEAVAGSFEELYAASPTFRKLADSQGVTISAALEVAA